jgi:short-subunit dehydrogenase
MTNARARRAFVVTGVTSGIGLALARALTQTAERLVIVGRNETRLRAATEAITGRQERKLDIIPILADLATLSGTESLAFAPPSAGSTGVPRTV